ncbi:methylated-DNA--[protein]-cysteine S-methyltransferase [Pelomonas sp. SE-A7]|uniref:methylated-DNA--[protein]-cysteine S-methyltransferase n=1 Tax=Pelomonas sp. SE-A7 TaxID=3054953 RepID=UPI00259D269D|nr:methylated-DNA--[protein]-cysteine S-methyltransferase [Pelomonas sp. SE-A7]MDM4765071.1 methylated-DNA--[protein]-cysteine S-methyltransferase [Pelomonas sp. SE-A7]
MQAQQRIATPLGPLTALRDDQGLVGLWFDGQKHHPGPLEAPLVEHDPLLDQVASALAAYFEGQVLPKDLPLSPRGTEFQQAVWRALLEIPAGQSRSYGELAAQLGRPEAARAVGAAVGRNPVSILIPCHRVLGRDGSLTGYAGGLERKQSLLKLEGLLQ